MGWKKKFVEKWLREFKGQRSSFEQRVRTVLEVLDDLGLEKFKLLLAISREPGSQKWWVEPSSYPVLKRKLDKLAEEGWVVDDLRAGRISWLAGSKLRVELPLNADLKGYFPAVRVYQDFFLSLRGEPDYVTRYLIGEYRRGRKLTDLAKELNEAIEAWAEGEIPQLWQERGLDCFLRGKGYTPDNFALYDAKRVRRLIRWHTKGE